MCVCLGRAAGLGVDVSDIIMMQYFSDAGSKRCVSIVH